MSPLAHLEPYRQSSLCNSSVRETPRELLTPHQQRTEGLLVLFTGQGVGKSVLNSFVSQRQDEGSLGWDAFGN